MKGLSKLVLPLVLVFAVFTGILAWQAGFFSFTPHVIAPGANSLQIRGIDRISASRSAERLDLDGFMAQGTQTVAILNSEVVEEEGVLTVQVGTKSYTLLVTEITEERIMLSVQ